MEGNTQKQKNPSLKDTLAFAAWVVARQNISTTRSFERNYTKLSELEELITSFTISCAEKLRKQKLCCNSLMVFINTNRRRTELLQYNQNIIVRLPYSTNSSLEITNFAVQVLHRIFKEGYQYKKMGVIIMEFTDEGKSQINMFENSDKQHKLLMESVDKINARYGQHKIKLASQDLKNCGK